jgi:hypothetical protein
MIQIPYIPQFPPQIIGAGVVSSSVLLWHWVSPPTVIHYVLVTVTHHVTITVTGFTWHNGTPTEVRYRQHILETSIKLEKIKEIDGVGYWQV